MTDINRVIGASQPFLNNDGTVSPPWFRFLAALAKGGDSSTTIENGPMTPYHVPPEGVFVVPIDKQALFEMNIDNEGLLVVDGFLIEVD